MRDENQSIESEPVEPIAIAPETVEPQKPRRGRPPGSGKKAVQEQPIDLNAPVTLDAEKKRPGRPPGSGKKSESKRVTNIPAFANQLQFWHGAAAKVLKEPLLEIDGDESKILAEAIAKMMEEFDVTISGRTSAVLGIIVAAGAVYGPRFLFLKEKHDAAMRAKKNLSVVPQNG